MLVKKLVLLIRVKAAGSSRSQVVVVFIAIQSNPQLTSSKSYWREDRQARNGAYATTMSIIDSIVLSDDASIIFTVLFVFIVEIFLFGGSVWLWEQ